MLRIVYKPPGEAVIQVFANKTAKMERNTILQKQMEIRKAMEDEIMNQGPRKVTKHCGTDEERKQLNVVDIGIGSSGLHDSNIPIFVNYLKKYASFVYDERPNISCIHIEIGK